MPLTKAQAENFVQEFFRDHRLPAPAIGTRRKFMVTLAKWERLNLPQTITRQALADQVAARLCRECVIRSVWRHYHEKTFGLGALGVKKPKRPRILRHFAEWQKYVRGVVVHHFGKGDGLA